MWLCLRGIRKWVELFINAGANSDEDDDKPEGGEPNTRNPVPLQQVIVQMNNSITKLEQTLVEPDTIEESEIDKLFS